jgi:polyphosphate kinase
VRTLARAVLIPATMEPTLARNKRAGATQFDLRPVLLEAITPGLEALLERVFEREVMPALTPIALDQKHPLPDLPAGSVGIVVRFRRARPRTGIVLVAPLLPRVIAIEGQTESTVVRVEDAVARYVSKLFTTLPVERCWSFRITRRAGEPEQLHFVVARAA